MRASRRCVLCVPNGERAWEGRWESRISLELLVSWTKPILPEIQDIRMRKKDGSSLFLSFCKF
ncbi:two-component response regulator-like PRR95-like protein [Corchorus olitorius]|uniref:Two-component response regulator-like PRR95-like protein n=1 Tax=Corchorus olitorius TaxID=93759 RepID=A0A1R3KM17_9ROSI|nr:two-component response regulator-like PRR95-like protein [Corchorus olitorius]